MLVVEDEEDIAFPLVRTLEREGYDVAWVDSGEKALADVAGTPTDVMILDLGLPDMDGLEVCKKAREAGFGGAIMIVTARAGELDRVVGLDTGADDYLSKPFGLAELQARVRALLRRRTQDVVEVDGLRMELSGRRVLLDGDEISLANKEFELLRVLMTHAGQVVTREEILHAVWGDADMKSSKTLDMHMSWLRRKIGGEKRIATVRGVGFRYNSD